MSPPGLIQAIERAGLCTGGTVSFHHHLRNGDTVMAQTLDACAALGLQDLHIAPSSLFPCHASLIPHLQSGIVSRITTAYMTGPLADFITQGGLANPVQLTTHGGRARQIVEGELPIDLAVIAAPARSARGDLGGADGGSACGPLGYAMPDAKAARHVLALTGEEIAQLSRTCIPADHVQDWLAVPSLGDARQIASGTTARPVSEIGKKIADLTVEALLACGALRTGMRYQAGAGGVSLAVTQRVGTAMAAQNLRGDFAAGGITETLVKMKHDGLFERLMDVQAFDLEAVRSYARDPDHIAMSAGQYANPHDPDCVAHQLDVMILGAAEVDTDFNVNVTTTGTGRIIGGSGGHGDTAEGAALSVVVVPSASKGQPRIVKQVHCVTTPGQHVDLVVCDLGICVNPARPDLARDVQRAGLPLCDIHALAQVMPPRSRGRAVAVSQDRHGTVLDQVHASRMTPDA